MQVLLREATETDLELMMAWRSNPLVYQGFYTQDKPLTWEEHLNWWRSRNKDWRTFIILIQDQMTHADISYEDGLWRKRCVGVVNVGQLDHWSPEVGYYVGEVTLWGKGIGKEAVRLALEWIKNYGKDHTHITGIHTTIPDNNEKSIRLIKSLGFEYLGPARPGESWWQKKL